MKSTTESSKLMKKHYDRIEKAIIFISENISKPPTLDEIASYVGLSPFHFQRLFRRWVGVSPKRFEQSLKIEMTKPSLQSNETTLSTAITSDLSSTGRLHDLFVKLEAITPGQYKSKGEKLLLRYGIHWTPFGACMIVQSNVGICNLEFINKLKLELEGANIEKILRKNGQMQN
ncbi:helix-turn-helix domain-containing protein [Piscirickettsia litoralis]|uniref:helix-turn-helix domain-containing protein n=1 Tax=Piscirickettsia litoralis TaxID=1891921 RepID=UPI0009818BB1|nr:AraC family transcriptional regulator [Piscirickettsia litoralis]